MGAVLTLVWFGLVPLHLAVQHLRGAVLGVEAVVALLVPNKQLVLVNQLGQDHAQPLPQQPPGIMHHIIDHNHLQLPVQVDVPDAQAVPHEAVGVEGQLLGPLLPGHTLLGQFVVQPQDLVGRALLADLGQRHLAQQRLRVG